MNKTIFKEKISRLEKELGFLKEAIKTEPDFSVDEKIWKEVRLTAKKSRQKLYQSRYGRK